MNQITALPEDVNPPIQNTGQHFSHSASRLRARKAAGTWIPWNKRKRKAYRWYHHFWHSLKSSASKFFSPLIQRRQKKKQLQALRMKYTPDKVSAYHKRNIKKIEKRRQHR